MEKIRTPLFGKFWKLNSPPPFTLHKGETKEGSNYETILVFFYFWKDISY